MPDYKPGRLIKDARRAKNLTQEDVAAWISVDRSAISQLETTGRKTPLDPDKTRILARGLDISPLVLLQAMGYETGFDGIRGEEEVVLLSAFRKLDSRDQRRVGAVAGLPEDWMTVTVLRSLLRQAEMDLRDRRETEA